MIPVATGLIQRFRDDIFAASLMPPRCLAFDDPGWFYLYIPPDSDIVLNVWFALKTQEPEQDEETDLWLSVVCLYDWLI